MQGNEHVEHSHALRRSPHAVQFYEHLDTLLAGLIEFVSGALVRGESVVLILRTGFAARPEKILASRGLDLVTAARNGQYQQFGAAEVLSKIMVDQLPVWQKFSAQIVPVLARAAAASKAPNHHIEIFGEAVALLFEQGNHQAALEIEKFWDLLSESYNFSLHCAYPISSFEGDNAMLFASVCHLHSATSLADVSAESIFRLTRQRVNGLLKKL
jgi:hypothetical protein